MADKGYNGWSNRATWNLVLWISNNERYYMTLMAYSGTLPEFKKTCKEVFGDKTPDGCKLSSVNWKEAYEGFKR